MRISVHSKNCKKYQNKEENKMAKKKEQKDMAQEQEQRLNFQQKLIEILELGKRKRICSNIRKLQIFQGLKSGSGEV